MVSSSATPLFRPAAIFLIALSLSIGWGIRGNFGHESGAWIPGGLAAIAICVLSRREDWGRRVGYCALFGGLGWGFGGSISYMWPMSFAGSGQWESIAFGFFGIFLVGGTWAGLGAAGTALPLAMNRQELTKFMTPFLFVLAALILKKFSFEYLVDFLKTPDAVGMDGVWNRHKNPLYWFDADWLEALFAGIGVCIYDLYERKFSKAGQLVLLAGGGAGAGWGIQQGLTVSGLLPSLLRWTVVPMGDPTAVDPKTNQPFDAANMLNNWPQFFGDFPQYIGIWIGITLGVTLYFWIYGHWNHHSGLLATMVIGWYAAFLAMPVFGSVCVPDWGGFRLTPPRGDNWAGCLGVLIATIWWSLRNGLGPVAFAGAMNFILGGIVFATMFLLRNLAQLPGHRSLTHLTGGTPPDWQHYQSANWHSVLEQSQGFGHGLITAITFGWLWRRMKVASNLPQERRWTDVVSIGLAVFLLTYVNVFKNVVEWTKVSTNPAEVRFLVPEMMKAPFFKSIELSAATWFNLSWLAITLAFVGMMVVHLRKPVAMIPSTWQGKGQLIYLAILWIMVVSNFERALRGFNEQRLVTEWVIIINGALASFLILTLPLPTLDFNPSRPVNYSESIRRVLLRGIPIAALTMFCFSLLTYRIFGQPDLPGAQYRWGPKAEWRIKPILKNSQHR